MSRDNSLCWLVIELNIDVICSYFVCRVSMIRVKLVGICYLKFNCLVRHVFVKPLKMSPEDDDGKTFLIKSLNFSCVKFATAQ